MGVSSTKTDLKQQLAALSPAKRALLELKLMKRNGGRQAAEEKIPRRAERGPAPLSQNQQGLWVLSQLMPDSFLYQIPKALRLNGNLNIEALRRTLDAIIERHESLRTIFKKVDGVPMQVVVDHVEIELPLIDLSAMPEAEREAEARRILALEGRRPFDLSEGPLIRCHLLRLAESEHILLITTHHIVTDGWSMGILHRELMELYQAFAAGQPSPLAELPIQYTDYAVWHRQWFEGDVFESQLAYWKKQFATLPPVLELLTDHARSNFQGYRAYRGLQQMLTLSPELTRQINDFCRREEATPFMTLLAAFKVLLHRYTGEEDIVVGSPIAGRCMAETEPMIGLFINVLALRDDLSGDPTFRDLLTRVKDTALGAYANQDFPFETLVRELQPDRALTQNPIFQAMFVLQNEPMPSLEFAGIKSSHVQVDNVTTNFDLTLDIVERDGQYLIKFESNADLFEEATIERMMGHLETLLAGIIANPQQTISELPMLTDDQRRQLLVEWTNTSTDYPANKCVHELFDDQVERAPEAIAVTFDDEQLTYAELSRRANRLANYLRTLGVGPDTLVGVHMERSAQLIVALLGIIKAGGAYLPLDLAYPKERMEFMLADAKAPVLLTEKRLLGDSPNTDAKTVCVDGEAELISSFSDVAPENVNAADDLIYVIYTSGSTGTPKGVAVPHRAVNRLVFNTNYVEITAEDRIAQASNASFDAATFEIWGALLHGAQLIGIPRDVTLSPRRFAEVLRRQKISMMFLTTALFNQIARDVPDAFATMRQLMFGGEAVDVGSVKQIIAHGSPERLVHVYGPTESTTFATAYLIESVPAEATTIPIGRAIANTQTFILDKNLKPVSIGVPGDLYLGGDGLAREYLNRTELTNEKFVANPCTAGERLYKTGDIARYLPDGNIEFIGRKDHQVKIRGFRIELGEIEAALAEHPFVAECLVNVIEGEYGDKRLIAYFVSSVMDEAHAGDLRDFMRNKLPEYMLPTAFVRLESLPLSPNGKIDRRALPVPETSEAAATSKYVPPRDELELKLSKIWEKVLPVRPIGVNDNFFDLGGHSLLAVRMFSLIEKSFERNLPLATLFQAPTISALAEVMRAESWPAAWSSLVVIQGGGTRPPFFCIHAAGGNVLEYYDLARNLGPDQPFYGLQARGLDGKEEPHTSVREMAAHYIKEMRDLQPDGPYFIGGRSSGGTIAFEMACQLKAAGEEVALLALLDTYPAGYFKLLPQGQGFRGRMQRQTERVRAHLTNLSEIRLADKFVYVASKLKYAPAKIKHKVYRRAYKLYRSIGRPLPTVLKNIEELNFMAVREYLPETYSGRATLFSATDLTASFDVEDGWRQLVSELEVHSIPGNHLDMIKEPHVQVLAEKLRQCLDMADPSRNETEAETSYAEPESTHEHPIAQHAAWRDARNHRNGKAVAFGGLRAAV
jgi:aspartate racemase